MEVTLEDIARELNISTATVSRSLRQDSLINPETRARVNEVAQRLGYKTRVRRPRRLVAPATGRTLGVLLRHESLDAAQHDANLMQMMTGIMSVIDSSGVQLQVHTIRLEEHRHMVEDPSVIPPMVQQGVCQAFIVHGNQVERDIAFLAERAPVVSMGRIYYDLPIDAAVSSNAEGVRAVVHHLVELGHRNLAWVGSGIPSSFMEARQSGFIQGCLHHGLEVNSRAFYGREIYKEPNHPEKGIEAALSRGVTAFVCGSDRTAAQVIKILEFVGRRVPHDVSVTGFDAVSNTGIPQRLTTVDPHFMEIGQVAAQLAMQRMTQPLARSCIVSVRGELVRGDTTAPPPQD